MQTSISLQEGRKGTPGQGGTEDPRCADRTARRQTVREVYLNGLFSASARRKQRFSSPLDQGSSKGFALSRRRDLEALIHFGGPREQTAFEVDRLLDSMAQRNATRREAACPAATDEHRRGSARNLAYTPAEFGDGNVYGALDMARREFARLSHVHDEEAWSSRNLSAQQRLQLWWSQTPHAGLQRRRIACPRRSIARRRDGWSISAHRTVTGGGLDASVQPGRGGLSGRGRSGGEVLATGTADRRGLR